MKKLLSVVIAVALIASLSYAIAAPVTMGTGQSGTAGDATAFGLSAGVATAVGVGASAVIAGAALISATTRKAVAVVTTRAGAPQLQSSK